jgi:hypothetical protein
MSPSISSSDVQALRFGVATASLGLAATHTLESKLAALQNAGIRYCEVGFGSYMAWVREQIPGL